MTELDDRNVLLGVCGGIAAYKAAELARLLTRAGATVHTVLTEAATRFVAPLTFEALTGQRAAVSMWETVAARDAEARAIHHIEAGREADVVVVAPATANLIGQLAAGLAPDLLTCILLAADAPVLLCPAMNTRMWDNPLVQRNVTTLRETGRYTVLPPDSGPLACGEVGPGRLPEPSRILTHVARLVCRQDLAGVRVVVTAGPTREPLDPVRFLSNPSTGRMGCALARAAWLRGAHVTLVHGPLHVPPPEVDVRIAVETAAQMHEAVRAQAPGADVLLMAAAVADWRPARAHPRKQKKRGERRTVTLVRTPDILADTMGIGGLIRVGFAAETDQVLAHARTKLQGKRLDLIVANEVGPQATASGFGVPTNAGWLVRADGHERIEPCPKERFAHRVLDAVVPLLQRRREHVDA